MIKNMTKNSEKSKSEDHFRGVTKMVTIGKERQREINNGVFLPQRGRVTQAQG